MSRQVHGYPPGVERDYQLTLDPTVQVTIKTPTEGEKRRTAAAAGEAYSIGADGKIQGLDLSRIIARQERFVRAFVTKVKGYTDAAGNDIADGDGLVEHGSDDVLAEVAIEVERSLSLGAELSKKSDALPDS